MRLCYQVATPDVAVAPSVTAYQGPLSQSFRDIAALGYDGAELMTVDPDKLNWDEVKELAEKFHLSVPLVCTGEVYGQLGFSFVDPDLEKRQITIDRMCRIIDFASFLGANVNIGRIRGQYWPNIPREKTYQDAVTAFQTISDYAADNNVMIALETINILQSNFINTIAEGVKMVDDVSRPNFKLMADLFHMNMEEKDMAKAIRNYNDYIIYTHLSDTNRRYPGACGMDFRKIVQSFKDAGYDGTFSVEVLQLPNRETAAKKSMELLQPIFADVYGR